MKSKLSFLCALLLVLLSSFTAIKTGNKDFKVLSASSQTVYGGAAGSPVTTQYIIRLKALRCFTMSKDSAYAEGKIDVFQIVNGESTQSDKMKLKKGNLLTLMFTIVTPSDMGGADYQMKFPGSPLAQAPIASKSGVVIRYKGGKSRYLVVEDIKVTEPVIAP